MSRSHHPAPDADAPLHGKAPDPGEVRDPSPHGESPNGSFHFKEKEAWKSRPQEYPAVKENIGQSGPKGRPAAKKS